MRYQKGSILVFEVVMIFIFSLAVLAILSGAVYQFRVLRSTAYREQAFQVAEAGANYYQWRLSHYPTDYEDGTGEEGPYVHDYVDEDTQEVIGQFSLEITPPGVGTTISTIRSTGWTMAQPSVRRTVTVQYGIQSLARYALLTNSDISVGSASTFYGEVHSNGGIHFDGVATAPVYSARSTYTCTSSTGCNPSQTKNGIWGTASGSTQSFWDYPVPNVDYSSITSDLAVMKDAAQGDGLYVPASNAQGYLFVFQSNGTFRVYRVSSLRSHATGTDANGTTHSEDLDYQNKSEQTAICDPYPCEIPDNGLIFVEDRVWVEGTVDGRVTLAAARLPYNPSTAPSILLPNSITYESTDGSDVLGLIAQQDVLITYFAPNTLQIHAAFIAQNGSFQRYHFPGSLKNDLNVYGSVSSYGQPVTYFGTSGYEEREYTYDTNLLYNPPPFFPLSTGGARQISWSSD